MVREALEEKPAVIATPIKRAPEFVPTHENPLPPQPTQSVARTIKPSQPKPITEPAFSPLTAGRDGEPAGGSVKNTSSKVQNAAPNDMLSQRKSLTLDEQRVIDEIIRDLQRNLSESSGKGVTYHRERMEAASFLNLLKTFRQNPGGNSVLSAYFSFVRESDNAMRAFEREGLSTKSIEARREIAEATLDRNKQLQSP
ncbi:MAG: hypothetical protein HC904_04785 [Blastochloris sp.]|nr:hypothetical protein [Blastochloris sp.]